MDHKGRCLKMKTGFIGAGNMAGAILRGAVASGSFRAEQLGAFDVDAAKLGQLKQELDISVYGSAQQVVTDCDIVVLAVKPKMFPQVIDGIRDAVKEKMPLILSIAAGKTTGAICEFFGFEPALVRVMPNINARASAAMSAYCPNTLVTPEQEREVVRLLSACGKAIRLTEDYFPLFGVIAGSAPAFAFQFIDALARAGVKHGMAKPQALEIAAQTVLGSAELILRSGEHPWALIDAVCSPGGTTIEGVAKLEEHGLDTAVMKAVDAALEKDSKI